MTGITTGTATEPAAVTDYDAVIYDLDGTLVELAVDWQTVRELAAEEYEAAGVEPPESLWTMLEEATTDGLAAAVRRIIREHECLGARHSTLLPRASEAVERSVPVAVCSLNCERACRIALETHGLDDDMQEVVGRDTVEPWKPDPAPLVEISRRLSVDPEATLFVGDTDRDARAAKAAGMPFAWA